MDAGIIAAIIGGIAAVIGLAMATIAIVLGRAMKAANTTQPTEDDAPPQAPEFDTLNEDVSTPEGRPALDDPTAFTDPFAVNDEQGRDVSLEWGSVFDDETSEPETKFGFDDAPPSNQEFDDVTAPDRGPDDPDARSRA